MLGTISARIPRLRKPPLAGLLLITTLEISAAFILLCVTIPVISQRQSASAFIHGLSLCSGKPCYLDILPGKTIWEDAQNKLRGIQEIDLFENRDYALMDFHGYEDLPNFNGRLLLIPNLDPATGKKIVSELDLSPADNLTYVGGAILQLGTPCAAVRLGLDDLGLIYPGISIIARMDRIGNYFVIRPTSPVIQANLFNRIQSCADIDLESTQADFSWRGFVRYAE
jgi:hypothetical protein